MRPYLAILKDSFREALHSRVLWVMFAAITAILLALSPLHFAETLKGDVEFDEIKDWRQFAIALNTGKKDETGEPKSPRAAPIYGALPERIKKRIDGLASIEKGKGRADFDAAMESFIHLRGAIWSRNFHDEKAWQGDSLGVEAKALAAKGERRTFEEQRRLNRLLLESVCGDSLAKSEPRTTVLRYLVWDVPMIFPVPLARMKKLVPFVATYFVDYTFGLFGVLAAFLVSAPMISQMFDPGSLHVVVSRPISRTMLLLSKFLGGCAFTLLGAAYMLLGLWVYMGVQLDYWDARMLAGILVYVCMFAVYFAVVVAAALYWRNAIVAIVVGIAFWAFCFALGTFHNLVQAGAVVPSRASAIATFEGRHVVARRFPESPEDQLAEWTVVDGVGSWRTVSASRERRRPNGSWPSMGPLFLPKTRELGTVFAVRGLGNESNLRLGADEIGLPASIGPALPLGACAMFVDKHGDLLVAATGGLFRRRAAPVESDNATLFGFRLPFVESRDFELVGEIDVESAPESAAYDPVADRVVFYAPGELVVLRRHEGDVFETERRAKLPTNEFRRTRVAIGADQVLVLGRKGAIAVVTIDGMTPESEPERPAPREGATLARFVTTSPDGRTFAVGYENGRLWTMADGDKRWTRPSTWLQGDVWAGTFLDAEQLLVSHGPATRLSTIGVAGESVGTTKLVAAPPLTMFETVFFYVVRPLYLVCPKPGELSRTMFFFLTGETSVETDARWGDDDTIGDPWRPLVSSLIFMLVVLTGCCVYFERQDL